MRTPSYDTTMSRMGKGKREGDRGEEKKKRKKKKKMIHEE